MKKIFYSIFIVLFTFSYVNAIELSNEDRAILAHVVVNPDTWVAHSLSTPKGGEWAVRAKIDRWRESYLVEKDKPEYKTRAERQVIADAVIPLTEAQINELKIKLRMQELAIESLKAEGELPADYGVE